MCTVQGPWIWLVKEDLRKQAFGISSHILWKEKPVDFEPNVEQNTWQWWTSLDVILASIMLSLKNYILCILFEITMKSSFGEFWFLRHNHRAGFCFFGVFCFFFFFLSQTETLISHLPYTTLPYEHSDLKAFHFLFFFLVHLIRIWWACPYH